MKPVSLKARAQMLANAQVQHRGCQPREGWGLHSPWNECPELTLGAAGHCQPQFMGCSPLGRGSYYAWWFLSLRVPGQTKLINGSCWCFHASISQYNLGFQLGGQKAFSHVAPLILSVWESEDSLSNHYVKGPVACISSLNPCSKTAKVFFCYTAYRWGTPGSSGKLTPWNSHHHSMADPEFKPMPTWMDAKPGNLQCCSLPW